MKSLLQHRFLILILMSKDKILETLKAICKHGVYQSPQNNIQTLRSGLKKQRTAAFSSDQLQDVWTLNETLGKVLDILKTFKVIPQCLKFHNV